MNKMAILQAALTVLVVMAIVNRVEPLRKIVNGA